MKKRNHLSDLIELIQKLRPEEKKVVRKYIVAFETNATINQNKSLKLFNVLEKYPNLSAEKARRKINKDMDAESFDKMVKRLMEKLLESLILNINTNRKGAYSPLYRTKFSIRKQFMELLIIGGRGMDGKSIQILEKIISESKRFELYDELIEALRFKVRQLAARLKADEREAVQEEIEFFVRCQEATVRAIDWYHEYYAQTGRSGISNEKVGLLTEAISWCQEAYKETQSANVGYFLYLLMKEYYITVESFKMAKETGFKLLQLVETHPGIKTPNQLGIARLDLANTEQHLFDFEASAAHAKEAQKLFIPDSYNWELSNEIMLKALYYQNNLDGALELVNKMLLKIDAEVKPFHNSRYNYMKAVMLFRKQDYKQSFLALQDTREIEKDKDGWNIGIRILNTLNCIEREQTDMASNHILNFKKHIDRLGGMDQIRERDQVVCKVLSRLDKNDYNFAKTMTDCQDDLLALHSVEKDFRWDPNTYEMVVFHKWFEAKVKGEEYRFEVPEELVEWVNQPEEEFLAQMDSRTRVVASEDTQVEDEKELVPVYVPEPKK